MNENIQKLLLRVSDGLGQKEVQALIFLCGENIRTVEKDNIKDAKMLFSLLQSKDLISEDDLSFLKEILYRIGRKDILKKTLRITAPEMEHLQISTQHISSYRILLYEISESLTTDDVEMVKFLLYPGTAKITKTESMLDVITEMEKDAKLSEDDMKTLKDVLVEIRRFDLRQKVETYESQQGIQASFLDKPFENMCIQESSHNVNANSTKSETENKIPVPERHVEEYTLDKIPHGWCLIVNNHIFNKARSLGLTFKDRRGTEKDAEAITRVFKPRGYEVEEHKNLARKGILDIMEQYKKKDHSQSDSFVCFVLSHGDKGIVYGVDGEKVSIKELTNYFNGLNCQTLVGKPKVFFIQACQGDKDEKGVIYDKDGNESIYVNDGSEGRLPVNADFLTGFATVEDHTSLRDTESGSIYIQNLCKVLKDPQCFQEDLLSILTRLHQIIAIKDYTLTKEDGSEVCVKQMASFKSELRKLLILPLPSNE
ncbi:caspase-8-like [Mixophyes fleayi]|uniref:caspase-8-like n=1 Tax=Mixophyes fleayi TaxID=3061075 RepID=UPI003F4DF286